MIHRLLDALTARLTGLHTWPGANDPRLRCNLSGDLDEMVTATTHLKRMSSSSWQILVDTPDGQLRVVLAAVTPVVARGEIERHDRCQGWRGRAGLPEAGLHRTCPWCGGDAPRFLEVEIVNRFPHMGEAPGPDGWGGRVRCRGCGAVGPWGKGDTRKDAGASAWTRWNRRLNPRTGRMELP